MLTATLSAPAYAEGEDAAPAAAVTVAPGDAPATPAARRDGEARPTGRAGPASPGRR